MAAKTRLNLVQDLQSPISLNRARQCHHRCGVHIVRTRSSRKTRRSIQSTQPQRAADLLRELARSFGHKLIWRQLLERLIGPERNQEFGLHPIH
jgi:hypothetical protein